MLETNVSSTFLTAESFGISLINFKNEIIFYFDTESLILYKNLVVYILKKAPFGASSMVHEEPSYFSVKAASPGRTLPSRSSFDAPPPRHKYLH